METDTGKNKENLSFEWQAPNSVMRHTSALLLEEGKSKFLRSSTLILVLLLGLYYLLKPLPFEECNINLTTVILTMGLFGLGMSILAFIISPCLARFGFTKYKIDGKGISTRSLSVAGSHRWKHITKCEAIKPVKGIESVIYIACECQYKLDPVNLYFDADRRPFAETVYEYIITQLPPDPDPTKAISAFQPRRSDHILLTVATLIYACSVILLLPYAIRYWGEWSYSIVVLLTMCGGPGTIGLLALYRSRIVDKKGWPYWAFMYNFVAVALFGLLLTIAMILYNREIFNDY